MNSERGATKIAAMDYTDLPLLAVAKDEYADLWDVETTTAKYEPVVTTRDDIGWADLPVGAGRLKQWRSNDDWTEVCKIGVYARKDGTTAIAGDVELTGKGIMATMAKALGMLPNAQRLSIYTTVPPLVNTFTKGVRLALPDEGKQKVHVKLPPFKKYATKGPLPTGNFNQWNVARGLTKFSSVRWFLVESLPSAEKLLDIDFTLDDVEELEF